MIEFSMSDNESKTIELQSLKSYLLFLTHATTGAGMYLILPYSSSGMGRVETIKEYNSAVSVTCSQTTLTIDSSSTPIRVGLYKIGICG